MVESLQSGWEQGACQRKVEKFFTLSASLILLSMSFKLEQFSSLLSGMVQVVKWRFNEAVASCCPQSAAAVEQLISQQKREMEAAVFSLA